MQIAIDKYFKELLILMNQKSASDLHISVGSPPYIRVDSELFPLTFPALTEDECKKMLFSIMNRKQIRAFKENKVVDFSFGDKEIGRFRINVYRQRNSIAAAVRTVYDQIPSMKELGLPANMIRSMCNSPKGLILVAGPTGSGKTTTLASMVDYINHTRKCHILTIEDPVEYVHKNAQSLIHQRELGIDTHSFANALKYGLREDPDVVLLGELRDLETISSAITMAETGHLILSTVHTGDSSESLQRMVNVFPAEQQQKVAIQLSFNLVAVMNQQLIRRRDKSGLALASEILISTPAIRNVIREQKLEGIYSLIQLGSKYGMKTMNQSLCELVKQGNISKKNALSKTARLKELERMLEDY